MRRFPTRSRRYGIGKEIGGAVYVHRLYEHVLSEDILRAKSLLPAGFDYTLVKYHPSSGAVTFVDSPDFDIAPEPLMGDAWRVAGDGHSHLYRRQSDPYIYHHKWLFVADDYQGFDIEKSKARSHRWLALPGIDFRRIGRLSYWSTEVLPRLL